MHIDWDDRKDREHLEKRGIGFEYISQLLSGPHVKIPNPGYPGQLKAIGKIEGEYWTLIIEPVEDEYGEFIWCSLEILC